MLTQWSFVIALERLALFKTSTALVHLAVYAEDVPPPSGLIVAAAERTMLRWDAT